MTAAAQGGSNYRWTILAIVAVANGMVAGLSIGLPVLGPAVRESFSLSLGQLGIVLASVEGGLSLTPLIWGRLADRIGERAVISIGLFSGAAALIVAASVDSFGALLPALVLCGAMIGAASTASGSAVMGWFARHERGLALGIRQMSVPIGGALAALALPLAVAAGGVSAALLALAAASVLIGVVAVIGIREPPPAGPNPGAPPAHERPKPLRDRRIWRLAMGGPIIVCAQAALLGFFVVFLHDHRGVSLGSAGAILAVMQIGAAAARLAVGRLSDKTGRRVAPQRWLAIASVVGFGLGAALVNGPLFLLVPILVVTGVCVMSGGGLAIATTAELAGRENAGTAIGLFQTVARTLSALAAVTFGALVGATSWPIGFALLAILSLIGWQILGPLVDDEEHRILARERRLAAHAAATR